MPPGRLGLWDLSRATAVASVGVCRLLQNLISQPAERSVAAQTAGLRASLGPVGLMYSLRLCKKAPKDGVGKKTQVWTE